MRSGPRAAAEGPALRMVTRMDCTAGAGGRDEPQREEVIRVRVPKEGPVLADGDQNGLYGSRGMEAGGQGSSGAESRGPQTTKPQNET